MLGLGSSTEFILSEVEGLTVNHALSAANVSAGAANNYRTPIPFMNPLTGEACPEQFGLTHCKQRRRVEDWATIAQATVDDGHVPYDYPKPLAANLVKPLDSW